MIGTALGIGASLVGGVLDEEKRRNLKTAEREKSLMITRQNQDKIEGIDPQATMNKRIQSQQAIKQATIEKALGNSNNQGNNMGGDVDTGNIGAVKNSAAAITAASGFAAAEGQARQDALQGEFQKRDMHQAMNRDAYKQAELEEEVSPQEGLLGKALTGVGGVKTLLDNFTPGDKKVDTTQPDPNKPKEQSSLFGDLGKGFNYLFGG